MLVRMRTALLPAALAILLVGPAVAAAQLPPPPAQWADWDTSWHPGDPGELSAEALLDKPAGRRGGIVVRDGHFYSGDARVRFWGVNLAFGANFPTHDMADQLARRFARYGINAVRFHHMDNQPFPNGIFAGSDLERLSPEALDRLDYFIAALKSRGVYADLNLHVSRGYNHYHRTAEGDDGPRVDKMVDLFDPVLIGAQKRYAADLLTHVNAYTHARYADEPAVGIVEINNENSLFMWRAEQTIADLPEPYAAELRRQWNAWLANRYGDRAKLAVAWSAGVEAAGPNLLRDPGDVRAWHLEQDGGVAASASAGERGVRVAVSRVDGTNWHVQLNQPGLKIEKGHTYRVRFTARADRPVTIAASVGQAHEPWQNFGGRSAKVGAERTTVTFGFTASSDDANARLTFVLGASPATVELADVELHAGGATGLSADEDLGAVRTVADDPSKPRHDDWLTFLENTEEAYYTGMRDHLHHDLGVRCPITGTIGFGPLGTEVQSHQDFVDAHAYWQHPSFPHRQWDMADWTIPNTPMVDEPAKATLWQLAATRVAGKPFTVTEYQHPAPSDWAAECIPEIATFAALQDWDGVFLFAYSHDANYDKGRIASFFDIEGNPTKMPLVPMGARLFLGWAVPALERLETRGVAPLQAAASANMTDMAAFLVRDAPAPQTDWMGERFAIRFTGPSEVQGAAPLVRVERTPTDVNRRLYWGGGRVFWGSVGSGLGQFEVYTPAAEIFAGFAGPLPTTMGMMPRGGGRPFYTTVVVPADPTKPIASAERLLVTAVARARNTDMVWNASRTSVGNHWGHAPVQIEVVHADVQVPGHWSHAYALDPAGKPTVVDVAEPAGGDTVLHLGRSTALGYLVVR
jgi:hypothetical protein